MFPEYSYEWLEDELDTVATRTADPFYISEENKENPKRGLSVLEGERPQVSWQRHIWLPKQKRRLSIIFLRREIIL